MCTRARRRQRMRDRGRKLICRVIKTQQRAHTKKEYHAGAGSRQQRICQAEDKEQKQHRTYTRGEGDVVASLFILFLSSQKIPSGSLSLRLVRAVAEG